MPNLSPKKYGPRNDSVLIQCSPAVSTSQTQYTCSCMTDDSSQTELHTKNKKNQECEATVETRDACEQRMFSCSDNGVQAVTFQTNSAADTHSIGTHSVMQTEAPLWSDFDRTPEMLLTSQLEASQQTSPAEVWDVASLLEMELSSRIAQAKCELMVEKDCETRVETEDDEVQAVAEQIEVATGQADGDNWIKVYLAELDEEKRQRMIDIGIQTGVLARVQHMYERKSSGVDSLAAPEATRPAVRLKQQDDGLANSAGGRRVMTPQQHNISSTQGTSSLPHSSISESQSPVDRLTTSPQVFRSTTRSPSFKKVQPQIEVSRRVSDLRARFEKSKTPLKNGGGRTLTRSSSNER